MEQLDLRRRCQLCSLQQAHRHRSVGRTVRAQSEQGVGQFIGELALRPAAHDPLGEAAEVLDEQDAQADRNRPQLPDRQRLDLLIRPHHSPQRLGIEAAVGVGDIGPRQTQDAWVARQMALGDLGELAVVVRRQVVADLANLFIDDREVVDEPLGRRRDRTLLLDRPRQHSV